ncbi:MAG: S16 family serine protease [Micrococcus sp.]|nr:S16 family serine protease [Micrococcus sp.]
MRSRARLAGPIAALSAAVVLLSPTPYIVESPGPAIDVLGQYRERDVLTVAEIRDDGLVDDPATGEGRLDLTTVMVGGPPISQTAVGDVVSAVLDPTVDLRPRELVYPTGTSAEEVSAGNAAAMTSSQSLATAAALNLLEIDFTAQLVVQGFTDDSAARDTLRADDVLLTAAGEQVRTVTGLKEILNDSDGQPVPMTVRRDGEETHLNVPVAPAPDWSFDTWAIGAYLATDYEFPVDLDIALEDIGGPSAGLMFTLAVVDRLSPGDLTGGLHVAGTGTVTDTGLVGPIGGIAQKVHGARAQGAELFLAPRQNCAELDGRVPEGIDAYGVDTVAQARDTIAAVAAGEQPDAVPRCG